MFVEGHVDDAIFQSTYLKDWYTTASTPPSKNGALLREVRATGSSSTAASTRARATPGIRQLEEDAKKYNLKGVKLYTAEWHEGLPRLAS